MKPILFLILSVFSITGCKETIPNKTASTIVVKVKPIVIASVEVLKENLILNEIRRYYKEKPSNCLSFKVVVK